MDTNNEDELTINIIDSNFNCLIFSTKSSPDKLIVRSTEDLIYYCFNSLTALYLTNQCVVTITSFLGNLISSHESGDHFCASLFSVDNLESLCHKALSFETIKAFLHVTCSFYQLSLEVVSGKSLNTIPLISSIELPANIIWSFMVLSEIFGTKSILMDCKLKLQNMILNSGGMSSSLLDFFKDLNLHVFFENLSAHLKKYPAKVFNIPKKQILTQASLEQPNYPNNPTNSNNSNNSNNSKTLNQEEYTNNQTPSFSQQTSNDNRCYDFDEYSLDSWGPETDETSKLINSFRLSSLSLSTPLPNSAAKIGSEIDSRSSRPILSRSLNSSSSNFLSTYDHSSSDINYRRNHIEYPNPNSMSITSKSPVLTRSVSPSTPKRWVASTRPLKPDLSPTELSRSESPNRKGLSREDLQLSREIALLRVKEAKIKEDLETSKLLVEKSLRENRLKSLELKASVLRLGKVPSSASKASSSSSKANLNQYRSNSAPRIRISDESPMKKSYEKKNLEEQVILVEEARLKAIERIKSKKRQEELDKLNSKRQPNKVVRTSQNSINQISQSDVLHSNSKSSPKKQISKPSNDLWKNAYESIASVSTSYYTEPIYNHAALEAVGRGQSPTKVRRLLLDDLDVSSNTNTELYESIKIYQSKNAENIKKSPEIKLKIIRAWNLPECLGGTNSYVLVTINQNKQARTQTIINAIDPHYNETISFTWDQLPIDMLFDTSSEYIAQIYIYNKNKSISDEMIASGEFDLIYLLNHSETGIVYLYDHQQHSAGFIEMTAKLIQ